MNSLDFFNQNFRFMPTGMQASIYWGELALVEGLDRLAEESLIKEKKDRFRDLLLCF